MKYSETRIGRTFILRLEDNDNLRDVLEKFAKEKEISYASCLFLGGIKRGTKTVVGPEKSDEMPPRPMINELSETHEVVGVGTIFPDAGGKDDDGAGGIPP